MNVDLLSSPVPICPLFLYTTSDSSVPPHTDADVTGYANISEQYANEGQWIFINALDYIQVDSWELRLNVIGGQVHRNFVTFSV